MIVHLEGLVVLVGELVRVPELDEGEWIVLAQLARQRFDLTAGRPQIAGQREDSNEQAPALDVVGVTAELVAQDLDRIALAVLARQRRRALERRSCRAAASRAATHAPQATGRSSAHQSVEAARANAHPET